MGRARRRWQWRRHSLQRSRQRRHAHGTGLVQRQQRQYPFAGLTLSGNTLYGTTENGGANGDGTVFSLPISGGSPTVLASFNGSNGKFPRPA